MAETLVFDPTSEDPANSPLTINTGNYALSEHHYPQPPIEPQWASSVSTEGERLASNRHQNRQIAIVLWVTGLPALRTLQGKLGKLHREGGTFQRTMTDGKVITFDVLAVDGYDPAQDYVFYAGVATVPFTLTCKPYGRGAEVALTTHTETTLPALTFAETVIGGDMPALGRLVVTNDATINQWWMAWGLQSKNYDATTSLFFEAEGRTAYGGSAVVAGPTGASGSNVMRNTSLTLDWQAILSTQTTGGGAQLTHIGGYRVYARTQVPATNIGKVSVKLEWAYGDFTSATQNAATTIDPNWAGSWQILDLGLVTIPTGSQRWEGRVLAQSTVLGDDMDIDWLLLVPTDDGFGVASALVPTATPTAFLARDEFNQTSGTALNGLALPVGGTWATSGATTDFNISGQATLVRIPTVTGARYAIAGTTVFIDTAVQVDVVAASVTNAREGVLLRWTDASNHLRVYLDGGNLIVEKVVAGVTTRLRNVSPGMTTGRISVALSANGRFFVWLTPTSGSKTLAASGSDSDLLTGGTLASGKVGIYDNPAATTVSSQYDNFSAYVPVFDAVAYAGRTVEVRSDRVIRQDSTGATTRAPAVYEGSYLRLPPSGAESRAVRMLVKFSRNVPGVGPDDGTDDLHAQLYVTPRYLAIPS